MKLASAIEGGLAGATTLSLLGETLRKIDDHSSADLFKGNNLVKTFKKAKTKKAAKARKLWIQLAGELLGSTAFLGFSSLGKKKNAALRGALLGTAAGLGSVMLDGHDHPHSLDDNRHTLLKKPADPVLAKAVEVALFTVGGLIAGKMVQATGRKKKKK
ncbi:MAG TPA: hypothetical protein VFL47_08680 [Flavisolibacter sp.]|nr:hypothetical protein [Flavisolibacter sp.]